MRFAAIIVLLGAGVVGCTVEAPPPEPRPRVVEERVYVDDAPPPPEVVEVVPVRPYYGAVWERGHWVHYRHRWVWEHGHWR